MFQAYERISRSAREAPRRGGPERGGHRRGADGPCRSQAAAACRAGHTVPRASLLRQLFAATPPDLADRRASLRPDRSTPADGESAPAIAAPSRRGMIAMVPLLSLLFLATPTTEAQQDVIDANWALIDRAESNLIHIQYQLVCRQSRVSSSGRGFVLSSSDDFHLVATALHVLFPEEKDALRLAADLCSYFVEFKASSKSPTAYLSLGLEQILGSIAGAKPEVPPGAEARAGAQRNALIPEFYRNILKWSAGVPYIAGAPAEQDIVLLRLPVPDRDHPGGRRTFDTMCGEEDSRDIFGKPLITFLAGTGSTVKPQIVKTHDGIEWQTVQGEKICKRDSGSPVFLLIDEGSCIEKLVFAGVISSASPFDNEGRRRPCNRNFKAARPNALWNTLLEDPVFSSNEYDYALLRCAHAVANVRRSLRSPAVPADDELLPVFTALKTIRDDPEHCECRDTSRFYSTITDLLRERAGGAGQRLLRFVIPGPSRSNLAVRDASVEKGRRALAALQRGSELEAAALYTGLPEGYEAIVVALGKEMREAGPRIDLAEMQTDELSRLRSLYPKIYDELTAATGYPGDLRNHLVAAAPPPAAPPAAVPPSRPNGP